MEKNLCIFVYYVLLHHTIYKHLWISIGIFTKNITYTLYTTNVNEIIHPQFVFR